MSFNSKSFNWTLLWSWNEWSILKQNQKHSRPFGGLAFSTLKFRVLNYVSRLGWTDNFCFAFVIKLAQNDAFCSVFPGMGAISSTFLGTLISIRNMFVISFRRLHCQPGWGTMIIFCINATRHYLTFLSSCHWFVMTMVVEIRRKMMRNEIK